MDGGRLIYARALIHSSAVEALEDHYNLRLPRMFQQFIFAWNMDQIEALEAVHVAHAEVLAEQNGTLEGLCAARLVILALQVTCSRKSGCL